MGFIAIKYIFDQNPNPPGIPPCPPIGGIPPGNPPPIPPPIGMFLGINPLAYNKFTIPPSIPYNNSITSYSLKCSKE